MSCKVSVINCCHQMQGSPLLFHEDGFDAICISQQMDILILFSCAQDLITLLHPG